MKQTKNAVKLLCGIVALGLLLSACSSGQTLTPSPSPGAGSPAPNDNRFAKQMKLTVFNSGAFNPGAAMPPREEDPIRQMLEKAVNIDLQYMIVPGDQSAAKLNTLISSGDIPDLMFMSNRQDAIQYYNQGIALDMDEPLKAYPELRNRFSATQWDAVKNKGKTFGIPAYDVASGFQAWWIRNDWLKKLGLKQPTNPDELLEVMKAFTFKDPDGNGKDDTYGFIGGVGKDGSIGNQGWDSIMLMFGITPSDTQYSDGKLIIGSEDPRLKEALTFINKIIEAKVVDPDWVSMNESASRDAKMFKGKGGIVLNDLRRMEPSGQAKMKEVGGEVPEWTVMAPPKGPRGDQTAGYEAFQNNSWLISKVAAKDPAKLTRILDFLNYWYTDKELYPYVAYGLKGTQWDLVDGKAKRLNVSPDVTNKTLWITNYFMPRRVDDPIFFNFLNPQTAEFRQNNLKYIQPNKITPYVVADPADPLYNDRKKYVNEMVLKFMTGKEPLSNWDSYVNTLNSKFELGKFKELTTKQLQEAGIIK
ncbi:extracellular solute-binding protein [Paenibacillus sp. GCM10023248]|uniref:extracellular solute-binding protein n=1 Tax=Bacillales TaxID=1385 RepID=UPI002378B042|nr:MULTISPECIES: extracellular solute-binding protein [Bacillales]MDD9271202.1 extracellular solute-binding protein [Paenibacillus sp. MAHUQ-63]MDR6881680.1 putative aldouronate transport system substrate-binding protein [Bacillus sp. 3255]